MNTRDNLGNLDVNERIILKWVLKKQDGTAQTGFMWLSTNHRQDLVNTTMNISVP
jgi:hypothetical protein